MKTKTAIMSLLVAFIFFGCSKDKDKDDFHFGTDNLIGTWRITHLYEDGNFIDVTAYPYSLVFEPTYATFYSDGTYSGEGYFGDGNGTYTATGKTITCYSLRGTVYFKYEVVSLSGNECILIMNDSCSSIKIKCRKI